MYRLLAKGECQFLQLIDLCLHSMDNILHKINLGGWRHGKDLTGCCVIGGSMKFWLVGGIPWLTCWPAKPFVCLHVGSRLLDVLVLGGHGFQLDARVDHAVMHNY